jgi:hypothetical protein
VDALLVSKGLDFLPERGICSLGLLKLLWEVARE